MNLSRRGFLGGILAACAAPMIVRSGVLMPIKALEIPTVAEVATYSGNVLLTPTEITREALRILHQKLHFITNVRSDIIDQPRSITLTIRRPEVFSLV